MSDKEVQIVYRKLIERAYQTPEQWPNSILTQLKQLDAEVVKDPRTFPLIGVIFEIEAQNQRHEPFQEYMLAFTDRFLPEGSPSSQGSKQAVLPASPFWFGSFLVDTLGFSYLDVMKAYWTLFDQRARVRAKEEVHGELLHYAFCNMSILQCWIGNLTKRVNESFSSIIPDAKADREIQREVVDNYDSIMGNLRVLEVNCDVSVCLTVLSHY